VFEFGLVVAVGVVVRVMVVVVGAGVKLLTCGGFCGGRFGYFFFAC
jgi:hypothetical protein